MSAPVLNLLLSLVPFILLLSLTCATAPSDTTTSLNPSSRQTTAVSKDFIVDAINSQPLDEADRKIVIDAAKGLIEELSPHRAEHRTLLNVDPVADLDDLSTDVSSMSDFEFHARMTAIFSSMKDQHTVYIPPEPLSSATATLGFFIRLYFPAGSTRPRFTRGGLRSTFPIDAPDFPLGSRILKVDGQEIAKLSRRLGAELRIFSVAAQFDIGASAVSHRTLALNALPRRNEATIRYVHPNGTKLQVKFPWTYYLPYDPSPSRQILPAGRTTSSAPASNKVPAFTDTGAAGSASRHPPADEDETHKDIFVPGASTRSVVTHAVHQDATDEVQITPIEVLAPLTGSVSASIVKIPSVGKVGQLRLSELQVDIEGAEAEFKRLLSLLPTDKLLIRASGFSSASPSVVRILLALISGKELPPSPFVVRASETLWSILEPQGPDGLLFGFGQRAFYALRDAYRRGAQFTPPFSDKFSLEGDFSSRVPPVERVFFGKVILWVSPRSSTVGDWMTALVRDLDIGYVVGVNGRTVGSACYETHYQFVRFFYPAVFRNDLPYGIDMYMAYQKFWRTSPRDGEEIDFRGVEPHEIYYQTLRDVLEDYIDRITFFVKKFDDL